ncbi:MAG: prolyl oligopeptidase family serine peptidase, partial [Candidatus Hodarchaeales archaeon]
WLELGGIFAIANLRGGGEFGEDWHDAGKLEKKQNVFDDFIAAGEYLIKEKYCTNETLAIFGGSNGGLLVGAATVQRPDLWQAVYCGVPLLDMLRYTRFSIAKFWIPEYGDPAKFEEFKWLREYSPYHNVKAKVDYLSKNPILLQVEGKAGHGVGKPKKKIIEEQTDLLSFMKWQLLDN